MEHKMCSQILIVVSTSFRVSNWPQLLSSINNQEFTRRMFTCGLLS